MTIEVSVVIVTYNSAEVVGGCLTSLREQTRGIEYEVTVVDNASSDETVDLVRRECPWVQLIVRADNGGLSRGINDGVLASSGESVMVLNPDVRMADDVLTKLAGYLREHSRCGVVAPKLLDEDGSLQLSCRSFPGYATALFNRYSLLTRLRPGNAASSRYLMSGFDHASIRNIDWVSGAALMFPRHVFDEVGGWDEGFFLFSEDVDFCRRVRDAGYDVTYDPEASLVHSIGISREATPRVIVERHRSMWRYYRKHMRKNAVVDAATGGAIAARGGLMLASHVAKRLANRKRARPDQSPER